MFSPEQIAEIQQLINSGALTPPDSRGRSPLRDRQLTDLRLVPTATDPRPLFLPSAEAPRDAKPYVRADHDFPTLRWHVATGQEITVKNADQLAALGADYTAVPVGSIPIDPLAGVREALASLTPAERDAIFARQKDLRAEQLQAQLLTLSDADLAAALQSLSTPKARKSA